MPLWLIPLIAAAAAVLKKALPPKYKRLIPWVAVAAGAAIEAIRGADPALGAMCSGLSVTAYETLGKLPALLRDPSGKGETAGS